MKRPNSPQNLTNRTLAGLFWTSSGSTIVSVLQILVLVVLARLLTPADFGIVTTGTIFIGFCAIFSQLGMGPAIIQRQNLGRRHIRTAFTISLLFGILMALILVVFSPLISRFFRMQGLIPILLAIASTFIVSSVSVVAESLLRRELKFRLLAQIQVISFVLGGMIVSCILAYLKFGPWALIIGDLVEVIAQTIWLLIVRPHPKRLYVNRRALKELMSFGSGFTLARILNRFALQGDYIVTGRWLGASALGFYSRAYSIIARPANLFGEMGDKVLFPTMAKIQNEPTRLATAFRKGISLVSCLTLPLSACVLILAPELVAVLFGPRWKPVVHPMQVLSAGIFFRMGYRISGMLARAKGSVNQLAFLQALYAIFVVVGAIIGSRFGITGVSVGVLIALMLHFLLMSRFSLSTLQITWKDFFMAHVPALNLTMAVLLITFLSASLLRTVTQSAPLVLFATISVVLLPSYILIRFLPKVFLGTDGMWWFATLTENARLKIKKFQMKFREPEAGNIESSKKSIVS